MTCSFCGSILDDDEVECPYCGHKTGVGSYRTAQEIYDDPEDGEVNFEEIGGEAYEEEGYPEEFQDGDAMDPYAEEEPLAPEQPRRRAASNSNAAAGSGKKQNGSFKLPKLNLKDGLDKLKKAGNSGSSAAPSGAAARSADWKKNPAGLTLIAIGACVLLSLISLISVISLSSKLEKNQQAVLSQMMQMQNNEQQMASQISALDSKVGNVGTVITEQTTSKNITITKQPTSSSTYLGRGGSEDSTQNVPIFTVTATGYDLDFTWQRYDDASGSWIDLVFDADSNNLTYGLHVYDDVSKGYSELSAHGVNADAYGSYRCQIADAYGTKNTDTVILSERSNS